MTNDFGRIADKIDNVAEALLKIAAQMERQNELLEARQSRDSEILRGLGDRAGLGRSWPSAKPTIVKDPSDA